MILVGFVGAIGSGKSAAARLLAEIADGIHLDADRAAQDVLDRPGVVACISYRFGDRVLRTDGGIDRRALAALAFADDRALADLEAYVHPLVLDRLHDSLRQARERRCPLAAVDIPLLIGRAEVFFPCDRILYVSASPETRRRRLEERGWDVAEAERRERHQAPDDLKRSRATDLLANDGTIEELRRGLVEFWSRLRRKPG
ncbi:MAG: dephospho-CoA kinase [Planctomycetes bacterium]|nr:dephospho-CoA kinase [Planctomycetota bacterium]